MTPIPVTKKTGTDGRTQMHQDLDLAAERPSGEAASVAALTSRSIAAHPAATFALVRIVASAGTTTDSSFFSDPPTIPGCDASIWDPNSRRDPVGVGHKTST